MIGFNGDDPLDPTAKKSLIDGLTGQSGGLGPAFGRAMARPAPGPSSAFGGAAAATQTGMGDIARDRMGGSGLDALTHPSEDFLGGLGQDLVGRTPTGSVDVPTLPSGGTATGPASVPGLQPSGDEGPGGITGNLPPTHQSQLGTVDDVYHHNYSSGSNIDNSGKNKFGRFKGALGHDPSDDEIRQFVAANPNEWEDSVSPTGEYVFRQKQGFLNDPSNLDSKTGATTIWQNRHFVNAAGSGDGYAPPYEEHQAELPGQTGAGPFGYLDPSLAGNPMPNIQDALAAVQRPGTIQEIIARLQRGG